MKTKILSLLFLACYWQGFSQIKIAPTSTNLCEGSNVMMKAIDIPANSTLQWQKNGEDISKAVFNEYPSNFTGNYTVKAIAQEYQWVTKKDPDNEYETLMDVFFVNAKVGYAVGGLNRGEIIKTTDGGKTWTNQNPGLYTYLASVYFIDEQNGWALGRYNTNTIIHTTDGGLNWTKITIEKDKPNTDYVQIQFTDAKNGWLLDKERRILRTTDGGVTWVAKPYDKPINQIYFKNPDNGWAIDFWRIWRTTDGGDSWDTNYIAGYTQPILEGISGFSSIYFLNDKRGWVACVGGIITTADGGKTWTKVDGIDRYDYLHTIHFTDEKTGFALTDGRIYYQTNDGGVTWKRKDTGIYGDLRAMFFIDNDNAWGTDYRGSIIKMSDNGNKWEVQRGNPEVFIDMSFVNANIGFRAGKKGIIEKTVDGGMTWKKQNSNTFTDITKIKFADVNIGWAIDIGDYGSSLSGLLTTTDGGETWKKKLFLNLESMVLIDTKNGLVLSNGSVYKTIDGGETWSETSLVSGLHNINFLDSKNGWVLGYNGTVLKTNNAGESWSKVNIPTVSNPQNVYQFIYFKNINEGWIVGNRAALRTTDGGLTWTEQNFEVQKTYDYWSIMSINFADDRNGWVLTGWGKLLHTTDGGATWKIEDAKFNKMFFLNSQTGWATDFSKKGLLRYETPILSTSNTITINPKPAVPTLAWSNTDGKLTATTTTTSPQLTWLKGVDELKNITATTYQPTSSGSYSVRVTDGNGCSEISNVVEITILSSENPLNESAVNVYPNPSNNGIFKVAYTRFSNEMEATMQVIGLDGLPLNSQKMVRQNNTFEGEINASNLATGIYLLQVVSGEQKAVVKISIAK